MSLSPTELIEKLCDIDEYEFEKLIADVWSARGWNTTVTTGSNDRGIDVLAEKDSPFDQKQVIQAKRYSSGNKISSPDIQQYSSLRQQENDVDAVIVITTSSFSKQARKTANDLNVKLIDGKELANIIFDIESYQNILSNYEIDQNIDNNDDASESETPEKTINEEDIHSLLNREEKPQLTNDPDTNLDIKNLDGSFPWLHYSAKDWKVPCPLCDEMVFNSEIAFRTHWQNPNKCQLYNDKNSENLKDNMINEAKSDHEQPDKDKLGEISPSLIISQAEGSFTKNILTRTSGRLNDQRLVDYLHTSEHLAYVFWHQYKGLRITQPDGTEETPHHDSSTSGSRFLLITDQRICYVAGLDQRDETQSFEYSQIAGIEKTNNLMSQWITFTLSDNTKYRFAETGTHANDISDAVKYVKNRIHTENPSETALHRSNISNNLVEQLITLFENHLSRRDNSDHWINLTFENNNQTATNYQYLNGLHNLVNLTSSQETALEKVLEQYNLTIDTEGEKFTSVKSGSQQPEVEAYLCLGLLQSVYDIQIEDVEHAAENDNGYQAW